MNGMLENVICPECKQGKHQNCTKVVIVDDIDGEDIYADCECERVGHD
jgi:hypothetical protein